MRAPDLKGADYSPAQAARLLRMPVADVLASTRRRDGLTAYRFRGERRLRIPAASLAAFRAVRR